MAEDFEPTNESAKEIWRVCRATVANPDCCGQTKIMALFIIQNLEMEERAERETEMMYAMKSQRDKLIEAAKNVIDITERNNMGSIAQLLKNAMPQ